MINKTLLKLWWNHNGSNLAGVFELTYGRMGVSIISYGLETFVSNVQIELNMLILYNENACR
jgi:hypothetical protein